MYQSENIITNVWFHLINPIIALPIFYFVLYKILKIERNSIEAKVMAGILITFFILVEFIVIILMIIRGNYLFYFIMYISGTIILLYTIYYTIKTIKDFSNNLITAQDNLKVSEEKYRLAYNNVKLYEDIFTHDINNIFQNFSLLFDLYQKYIKEVKDRNTSKELNDTIKYQLNRGVELINNIQLLSEVEMLKRDFIPINLFELLKDLISKIEINLPKDKVELKLNDKEQLIVVEADEFISQIFINLINNGIRHNSNEFKTVIINVSIEDMNSPRHVRIEVIDNGVGINFTHKQHLIKFFEDDVKSFTRSGLGLLVVKKLTSRYNGKILIEDRVHGDYTKGSKFIILIPTTY